MLSEPTSRRSRCFLAILALSLVFAPLSQINSQKNIDSSIENVGFPILPQADNVIGVDGDYTVNAVDTVLNRYTTLAANVSAGATSFQVASVAALDSPIAQMGPLAVGDLLMIIQMQGASINTTDTVNYGAVTSLNGAGNYELVTIGAINTATNTITINGEGCITGLRRSYSTAGRTQVIRVPQFRNLVINSGASVVPPAWNGSTGGVVALQVSRFLTINGSIGASGLGFRGGLLDTFSNLPGFNNYRSTSAADGAEKGEGIAGYQTSYDTQGRYGRGAPANGGGGGNSHNAGGGGGANGNNGNTWTGQGVMPNTPAAAWMLDPGYSGGFANSSGGGRGGYTYSSNNADALTTAPGSSSWGGDNRREVGGLGGRPVTNDPASTLFMGGGGGAGDANNNAGGAGGSGGGIIWLQAGTISGTGSIVSNGNNGANTRTGSSGNDAPGGGGAGGTIVISSFGLGGVSISADGGNGGNQTITGNEAEGPGGGGGGGYIAIRTGSPTRTANGGTGGTSNSAAVTEFTRNGSTNGANGQSNATVTAIPICISPSAGPTTVIGQVIDTFGRAIPRARLMLIDGNGNIQVAISNAFGFYKFAPIPSGGSVTLTVSAKGFLFASPTQIIEPRDSITETLFVADPQ